VRNRGTKGQRDTRDKGTKGQRDTRDRGTEGHEGQRYTARWVALGVTILWSLGWYSPLAQGRRRWGNRSGISLFGSMRSISASQFMSSPPNFLLLNNSDLPIKCDERAFRLPATSRKGTANRREGSTFRSWGMHEVQFAKSRRSSSSRARYATGRRTAHFYRGSRSRCQSNAQCSVSKDDGNEDWRSNSLIEVRASLSRLTTVPLFLCPV
jgi:hypothetical protein